MIETATAYLRSLPEMAEFTDAELRRFAVLFAAHLATRAA